jgi:hypothetical protein
MEVLLSLDDGRTYPYRVTQDGLEPGRVVRWEVPNVAFAAARVRLRYRISGREIDGAASERFTIVANPARAPDRLLPRENDREDVAGHGEPGPGSLAADRGPSFSAASADAVADPDPPDPDLTPRESRRVPAPGTVAATGSPALSPHTPRSFTPLRN